MNFVKLLFQQPYNIRKQVRNIETQEKKLIQAKMAVVYNNTCINENLLNTHTHTHTYMYIYIHILLLSHNFAEFYE